MIESVIKFFKFRPPPDPVKQCHVYNTVGCVHVDGPLCDFPTCKMKAVLVITPKEILDQHVDNSGK